VPSSGQRGLGQTEESHRLPIDPRRQGDIEAALAAHTATHRRPWLTPDAKRLLTAMFAEADVCQRNQESLMAEGFSRGILVQLLRDLIEVGLVSKERGVSRAPNTYRLHLPPRVQP
jgi:hypothetical protein